MLARTLRDLKILLLAEVFPSVQKRMADQGRPDHGRCSGREIERTRLIVEMISPASPAITWRLMLDKPLQRHLGAVRPGVVASGFVEADETPGQKAHAFGRAFLSHA